MISVLLPTIRPHLIERSFGSIRAAAGLVPYEVVIVADFGPAISDPTCTWIVTERKGVVDALFIAASFAKGDYFFSYNDESTLDPLTLEKLFVEAQRNRYQVLTPEHLPTFNFAYYGLPFAPFPFAHRDVLTEIGGIADPAYHAFYCDPDLSMRAHAQGLPVRSLEGAIIRHANNHDHPHQQAVSAYLEADRATFRTRWDHLGAFIDP